MNNWIKNNRHKLRFGLAVALAMSLTVVILFVSNLLLHAWTKGILVLIVLVGTWAYLRFLISRNGHQKMAYFPALREAAMVSMISFAVFGLFLYVFLKWVVPPGFLPMSSPAGVALATIFGGAFLSTIIAFILMPYFRRVNPENGMDDPESK